VCVTATFLDGLVLARSGFEHSMNYRSVMVLGRAYEVEDEAEKLATLEAFVEHLFPGRWAELRPATPKELRQTAVLWTDLAEASAKVRATGVHDEPADAKWPAWAGVVPVSLVAGDPEPDEGLLPGVALPAYLPAAGSVVEGAAPDGEAGRST
jgi:uncharacterized protein